MMDNAINRVLENPMLFSLAFAIVIIALGIFVRLVGNPVAIIFQSIAFLVPQILKEFTGKAGPAGTLNAVIVVSILVVAVAVLIKPTIISLFQAETTESRAFTELLRNRAHYDATISSVGLPFGLYRLS